MVDAVALRRVFGVFLGDERFRKFVHQGFRRGRLRYWQEQEWNRFIAVHPEFAISTEELEVALRVCELHGQELSLQPARQVNAVVQGWSAAMIPASWLRERLSPSEVDAAAEPTCAPGESLLDSLLAIGKHHSDLLWARALRAKMVEGDELWTYSTPAEDWANLGGRGGIALVRGGKVVDHVQVMMN
jgi:hypothetical protein